MGGVLAPGSWMLLAAHRPPGPLSVKFWNRTHSFAESSPLPLQVSSSRFRLHSGRSKRETWSLYIADELGALGGSDGKESACSVGDPGLIPVLGRPTPVFLLGESHGWRSLAGYSPWTCKKSDMTEQLQFHFGASMSLGSQLGSIFFTSKDLVEYRLKFTELLRHVSFSPCKPFCHRLYCWLIILGAILIHITVSQGSRRVLVSAMQKKNLMSLSHSGKTGFVYS